MRKRISLKSKKGASLVEVIVSVALFALIAVLFMGVLLPSLKMIRDNTELRVNIKSAQAGVEHAIAGGAEGSGTSGKFIIKFGSETVETEGDFVRGGDDGNVKLDYFIPD